MKLYFDYIIDSRPEIIKRACLSQSNTVKLNRFSRQTELPQVTCASLRSFIIHDCKFLEERKFRSFKITILMRGKI